MVVIAGGIIPDEDAAELKKPGCGGGFPARRLARENRRVHPLVIIGKSSSCN